MKFFVDFRLVNADLDRDLSSPKQLGFRMDLVKGNIILTPLFTHIKTDRCAKKVINYNGFGIKFKQD